MEYTYLLIDNSLYINVETNLINLMYFLFFRAKPFNFLERKTNSKVLNSFFPFVKFKRVMEFTYLFYRRKQIYSKSKDIFPTITSSFFGHCLIKLRLGEYKIIDFRKEVITTVYPSNFFNSEIKKNINKLIESQKCNLAPKIINWNIKNRYIKECYINLKNPSFEDINEYYSEVFPLLENIMLSKRPQNILIRQYIKELITSIDRLVDTYLNKNFNPDNSDLIILEFLSFIKEKVKIYSFKKEILLVLSHGDFWEGNILKDRTKISVIDWNTIDMRSLYFDFYFFFFDKISNIKREEGVTIGKKIDTAIKCFQSHLFKNTHIMQDYINDSVAYRYIFYLEFILLRLQEYPKRDLNHMDFLEIWINYFKLYETNQIEDSTVFSNEDKEKNFYTIY
ncbi:hypothetical protein [Lederbergia citrea]|uniref:hypothetical protein n=1 Tax=Lederbergia citrea TaxID=2833581 RepID=UPI001BC95C41|nr:hypothetical protein [Lederbergia citrea]MBS4179136.1 hypothetical protein [Lederbergia citrea]